MWTTGRESDMQNRQNKGSKEHETEKNYRLTLILLDYIEDDPSSRRKVATGGGEGVGDTHAAASRHF